MMQELTGPPVELSRQQIKGRKKLDANQMDVTVMTAAGLGKSFAPNWDMVMGVKSGRISHEEYKTLYYERLDALAGEVWGDLFEAGGSQGGKLVLMCYCRDGWQCHTHMLIDYAVRNFPLFFADGRAEKSLPIDLLSIVPGEDA